MPPAAVIPIRARSEGEYVLLRLALPGRPVHDVGVLLLDAEVTSERYEFLLRSHWDDLADSDDAAWLSGLKQDTLNKIGEMGPRRLLEQWEDSLSHALRVSERQRVPVDSFSRVADRIFESTVEKLPVDRFNTHLPLYTLRAAAGKFGAEEVVKEEDWVRVPKGLRLTERMFVAHVVGQSMLPRIPDGSLNIFRSPVVGSRQGKIVLVEMIGAHEKYTVKRYTSRKSISGDDEWRHEAIELQPLNPEFEPIHLQPDQLRVIAEWIQTLE